MGRARTALIVGALVSGLTACSKSVAVAVNIVTVGCAGSPDPFAADGGTPVAYLKFDVTVDGGAVFSQTTAIGSQTLQIPQLPLGTMVINVEGLPGATSDTIVAEGNSGPFVLPADGSVSQLSVSVFLRPTNTFSNTNSAASPGTCTHLVSARAYHSQALLADGKVLIYGGLVYSANVSPPDNTVDWTEALAMPPMYVPNTGYVSTAEIYDPQTGEFTAAGAAPPPDAGAAPIRAFSQMIPYTNGGALVTGGEFSSTATGLVAPAWNGEAFSPDPSAWAAVRTASPHDHGCLAADTSGHALVAGGYSQLSSDQEDQAPSVLITTPVVESLDPTVWPPKFAVAPNLDPPPNESIAPSRADQTCSGFDGVTGLFQGLALEIGGVYMDPTGVSATIDQDYVVYQLQAAPDGGAGFVPLLSPLPNLIPVDGGVLDAGPIILGAMLTQPRARAKAAAMIVTETSADGSSTVQGDAVLVTGGITCTPNGFSATCTPAYVNGVTSGQLANPPFSYFANDGGDVGSTTELIAFPPGPSGNSTVGPGFPAAAMQIDRIDHCAVALPDGRVVVLGGLSGADAAVFGTTSSAEVFSDNPSASTLPSVKSTVVLHGGLLEARAGMACTLLQDGSILVTGGFQTTGPLNGNSQQVVTLDSAEIYRPMPIAGAADGG